MYCKKNIFKGKPKIYSNISITGHTQQDVVNIVNRHFEEDISRSTLSKFESLTLSRNAMERTIRVLEKYLQLDKFPTTITEPSDEQQWQHVDDVRIDGLMNQGNEKVIHL